MLIQNRQALETFWDKHQGAKKALESWLNKVLAADWNNFAEVRPTFNSASYVKPWIIFNVAGNKYRVQSEIDFKRKIIKILRVGTHDEYDSWNL